MGKSVNPLNHVLGNVRLHILLPAVCERHLVRKGLVSRICSVRKGLNLPFVFI